MKNIVVVILNYLAYWETEKCVTSIKDKRLKISNIVIVDNSSGNESYKVLSKKYAKMENIKILRTHRNYGFAKGNNIGICYARNVLGAEYVLLLNSDIVITDEQYLNKLLKVETEQTAVIASRVLLPDGTGKLLTNAAYSTRDVLLTCVGTYVINSCSFRKNTHGYAVLYLIDTCQYHFHPGLDICPVQKQAVQPFHPDS